MNYFVAQVFKGTL